MPIKIFPKEILNFTIEQQVAKHSSRSQVIYMLLLLIFIGSISALPFVKVDVTVQSSGIIRPSQALSDINSPINGKINNLFFIDNQKVEAGDTLMTIDTGILKERKQKIEDRIKEIELYKIDLDQLQSKLNNSAFANVQHFSTSTYAQQYNQFKQNISELNTQYLKEKHDLSRNKTLFDTQAIAQTEYEDAKYQYDRSLAAFKTFHQTQLATWANEIRSYNEELTSLNGELSQIQKEAQNYIIVSPVSGSIQGSQGLVEGTIVFTGKKLFSISPNTELQVETYLLPKDIGLVKIGSKVKFQIDAFNYNQWGLATGIVKEISKDIIIQNDQPVFVVKCSLNESNLHLKNGYKGKLIKGMTLNSRFIITERTLWQLLYDKTDDWLNPNAL